MENIQRSLVLIKPDAVERNLVGKIIDAYEGEKLKITALRMITVDEILAKKHYEEHISKPFFNELLEYITRSPLVAIVLQGENAIEKVRKINGNTNPEMAEYGTIRKKYGIDKTKNSVHASDCEISAEREISIWFPEGVKK